MFAVSNPDVVKCSSSSSTGKLVKFADGSTVTSAGEGFLVVKGLTLKGLLLPFELNLISTKALGVEFNILTCLAGDGGLMFRGNELFAELVIRNNLYELVECEQAFSSEVVPTPSEEEIWQVHVQLGHLNTM